jgi:hypothetical protein
MSVSLTKSYKSGRLGFSPEFTVRHMYQNRHYQQAMAYAWGREDQGCALAGGHGSRDWDNFAQKYFWNRWLYDMAATYRASCLSSAFDAWQNGEQI